MIFSFDLFDVLRDFIDTMIPSQPVSLVAVVYKGCVYVQVLEQQSFVSLGSHWFVFFNHIDFCSFSFYVWWVLFVFPF